MCHIGLLNIDLPNCICFNTLFMKEKVPKHVYKYLKIIWKSTHYVKNN
jgi:hypothetical protein